MGGLLYLSACGGMEDDLDVEQAIATSELVVSTKCFPAGKSRWSKRSAGLFSQPTAASDLIRTFPKGAKLTLADRNSDGKVCRAKKTRSQEYWFISVRNAGKRGWAKVNALRATPPKQNPIPGYSVTTPFGTPGDWAAGYHTGDDYAAPIGNRVVATRPGTVKTVSRTAYGSAYGLHVVVQTGGVRHMYAHLSSASVSVGDKVGQGSKIGDSGNSGNTTGPHLHYEERVSPYGYYDHRKPRFNR